MLLSEHPPVSPWVSHHKCFWKACTLLLCCHWCLCQCLFYLVLSLMIGKSQSSSWTNLLCTQAVRGMLLNSKGDGLLEGRWQVVQEWEMCFPDTQIYPLSLLSLLNFLSIWLIGRIMYINTHTQMQQASLFANLCTDKPLDFFFFFFFPQRWSENVLMYGFCRKQEVGDSDQGCDLADLAV